MMNKGYILLITLFFSIFSLALSAQSKYPDPPENDSKEVMDKYQKAVDQWYLENPKTEEKEENIEPEKSIEKEVISGPNLTLKDIPKDAKVWKLSTIKVIENGVIDERLNDYQQAFVDKFTSNNLRIHIDQNKFAYIHLDHGVVKKFVLTISNDKITSQEDNCNRCPKYTSNIVTYNSSSLIVDKAFTDDKGNHFNVRFSYTIL